MSVRFGKGTGQIEWMSVAQRVQKLVGYLELVARELPSKLGNSISNSYATLLGDRGRVSQDCAHCLAVELFVRPKYIVEKECKVPCEDA